MLTSVTLIRCSPRVRSTPLSSVRKRTGGGISEVVWAVAGRDVTPARLAALGEDQVSDLARKFGEYFECDAPTVEQVQDAIAHTLARWPVGSLGEAAGPGAVPDPAGH